MPKLSEVYVSKWLKACAVSIDGAPEGRIELPGEPERIVLTIKDVDVEEFDDRSGGQKNKQAVLHWKEKMDGGKPIPSLGLNKTNAKIVADITGSTDTDDWPGHKVEVYVIEQDKSESGYALRVKKPKVNATAGTVPTTSPSVANGNTPSFFGGAWATKVRENLAKFNATEDKLRAELAAISVNVGTEPIENWPRSYMEHVQRVLKVLEADATVAVLPEDDIPF